MKVASAGRRYAEASRLLMALPRFTDQGRDAYRPGLERIRALLDVMGKPEREYPIIHVAGTNGKGTVASFAASLLGAAGVSTGLHTSPHVLEIGERMRVDGSPADRQWLGDRVLSYRREMKRISPSFFEMTVALSLLRFAEMKVDAAVVEVGLGGRLDATNAVHPAVSVITSVGLDHTEILGDSMESVATEKAGIIKENVPVVAGVKGPVDAVIRAVAATRSAPFENVHDSCRLTVHDLGPRSSRFTLETPVRAYREAAIDLPMRHQILNAALAVRSVEILSNALPLTIDVSSVLAGLGEMRTRSGLTGRFEVLSERPLIVADVAHNADGIAALLEHLRANIAGQLYVCIAMMKDKRVDAVAEALRKASARVLAVSVDSQRAFPAARLASLLKQPRLRVDNLGTVRKAVDWFQSVASAEDALLVTGSYLTVADALKVCSGTRSGETRST